MDESSTPVIQALSQFDSQTGQMVPQIAMGLLGTGMQGAQQASGNALQSQQLALMAGGQTQQMAGREQERLLNTFLQTAGPLAGMSARSATIGDIGRAQTWGNIFGGLTSLGTMGAMGAFGGGGMFGSDAFMGGGGSLGRRSGGGWNLGSPLEF